MREEVPALLKQEIKRHLIQAKVLDYSTLNMLIKYILAHLLSGEISEAQADAARKYLELMLATLSLDIAQRQGGDAEGVMTKSSVLKQLESAERNGKKIHKHLGKAIEAEFEDLR